MVLNIMPLETTIHYIYNYYGIAYILSYTRLIQKTLIAETIF